MSYKTGGQGKGDNRRPFNRKLWEDGWERIWGKEKTDDDNKTDKKGTTETKEDKEKS